jgi:hypothetical protein
MRIKGIARYAHVLTASAAPGADTSKYSINILIHKSDPQCKDIMKECDEVIKNDKELSKLPYDGLRKCFKDMAVEYPEQEALKDYMVMVASIKEEKGTLPVVDPSLQRIIDPGTQVDGKIVYIQCKPWPYSMSRTNSGLTCLLNGVLVTKEDGALPLESISSKPSIEKMFEGIETEYDSPNFK